MKYVMCYILENPVGVLKVLAGMACVIGYTRLYFGGLRQINNIFTGVILRMNNIYSGIIFTNQSDKSCYFTD